MLRIRFAALVAHHTVIPQGRQNLAGNPPSISLFGVSDTTRECRAGRNPPRPTPASVWRPRAGTSSEPVGIHQVPNASLIVNAVAAEDLVRPGDSAAAADSGHGRLLLHCGKVRRVSGGPLAGLFAAMLAQLEELDDARRGSPDPAETPDRQVSGATGRPGSATWLGRETGHKAALEQRQSASETDHS